MVQVQIDLTDELNDYLNIKKGLLKKKSKEETIIALLEKDMWADKIFLSYRTMHRDVDALIKI